MERIKDRKLVVVSNRLPVRTAQDENGKWEVQPSPGGLVTALNPVLEKNHGTWIGWVGCPTDDTIGPVLEEASRQHPYKLKHVALSEEDEALYYRGFSNEALWPLFHDLLGYCKFESEAWERYREINARFADAILPELDGETIAWVHDYQLCLAGQALRERGVEGPVIYFLHIPFPTPDLFRRLPWRSEILDGLLHYDLLGFQTRRDRENFVACAIDLMGAEGVEEQEHHTVLHYRGRTIHAGNWAISIDYDEFHDAARSKAIADEAWYFHEYFGDRILILGLDRLDYTKGIPERFLAFERLLEKYPDVRGRVSLYQCVVPSRTHVPDYQDLKRTIDELVGRINGRFSAAGWVPVHYAYRSLNRNQLLGRYRACEIAIITPLRDGMNLVAKEYCSSCVDDRGVLVLSEFAGAADEFADGALLVNPYDLEKTADTMYAAINMDPAERNERIKKLRHRVQTHDVHAWVRKIFRAARLVADS